MSERTHLIREFSFTPEQAFAVLHKYYAGLKAADVNDLEKLKKVHRELIKKHHPDKGGDVETMQKINVAIDTLKKGGLHASHSPGQRNSNVPEWAWAGYSGGMAPSGHIYRNNYNDLNFIKKDIWEKSGKSKEEWYVQLFDGKYFRNSFFTYGNKATFKDMTKAMLTWADKYYDKHAIFARKKGSNTWHLLWLKGKPYKGNITFPMSHADTNSQAFRDRLRNELDDLDKNVSKVRK